MEWHQVVVNNCKIPILTNTGPVEAKTRLIFPKETEDEEPAGGAGEDPTPAKKRKKNKTA